MHVARVEEGIFINRPVHQVFAYVADVKNLPKWESSTVEVEHITPGPMCLGSTLRGASEMMGQRAVWTARVTEYESNRRWSEIIASGRMLIERHLAFEQAEAGTKFTLVFEAQLSGLLGMFEASVIRGVREQAREVSSP